MKKLIITIICTVAIIIGIIFTTSLSTHKERNILAVWWWNDQLDTEIYFDYAVKNNITEIYYCNSSFDKNTKDFISLANKKDIKVYFLCGEYQWLENRTNLINKLNSYLEYQNNNSKYKFAGVHLDIEPHQNPNFDTNREILITALIQLVYDLENLYPTINFNYDIPFWFDDEITFNSNTKPAYQHIIDIADKVTIMSYRDTAEKIYSVAKDEIDYALSVKKKVNLAVECGDTGEDIVDFSQEGIQHLNKELKSLRSMLPKGFGIAIHHIKSWYDLT